jgi:hypothetical protein
MSNKAAWVSLICGILAYPLALLGPFLSVVAIIAGFMGRKKRDLKTMATVGLVLGIVWWILAAIGLVFGFLGGLLSLIGL